MKEKIRKNSEKEKTGGEKKGSLCNFQIPAKNKAKALIQGGAGSGERTVR